MIHKTNKDFFEDFLHDASNFQGNADGIFFPETSEEISEILIESAKSRTPITIAGAGTGLCGGSVPQSGAIISTKNLNKISDFDPVNKSIKVQAGVLYSELETFLMGSDLFLPPNPTEKNSSIGGNAATNASGAKSFKYGPFRNWVKSIKIILANGEIIKLNRGEHPIENDQLLLQTSKSVFNLQFYNIIFPEVKNSAGIFLKNGNDILDLFIGSEGTLGVISEIELNLADEPEKVFSGIVFFSDENAMLEFTSGLRKMSRVNSARITNEIEARAIEFFDENSLKILSDKFGNIPFRAKSAIWFEQEYSESNSEEILAMWNNFIISHTELYEFTLIALNPNEHERLREFRHQVPASVNEMVSRYGTRKIGTDSSVPVEYFEQFFYFVKTEIIKTEMEYAIWGHFGDCHIHANLIPKNDEEFKKGLKFYNRIIDKTIALGGSVSAEHGIGKIKKDYFKKMYGSQSINEMKKVKNLFDPMNLLGQGNLF